MNPVLMQELLTLAGVAIKEAQAFTDPNSTAGKVETLSADLLSAMNALLSRHSANIGQPIDQVLATL